MGFNHYWQRTERVQQTVDKFDGISDDNNMKIAILPILMTDYTSDTIHEWMILWSIQ